ncbi:hypothetical protein C8T65DRAFT_697275 [Cerioporus squamosus]|nr:hypothetical protein C8T65DRAFT_697275 [Cerioporus squamosus]
MAGLATMTAASTSRPRTLVSPSTVQSASTMIRLSGTHSGWPSGSLEQHRRLENRWLSRRGWVPPPSPSPAPSPPPPEPSPPPRAPSPPALLSRMGRWVWLPGRYEDYRPSAKTGLPSQITHAFPKPPQAEVEPQQEPEPQQERSPEAQEEANDNVEEVWDLEPDGFGLYRSYAGSLPKRDPLMATSLDTMLAAPGLQDEDMNSDEEAEQPSAGYRSIFWMT